eukprot:CAMPEP_0119058654 /NCGR_PEP_ID=MMETSP1178-20130426/2930_1 /TAXON_ID=33656 /ORGANISM="unid sp, Strain CCMP2000" /LENGTH=248 /DNA_ID=CAMNT_0007039617 /DNA_START=75 /DNA_END=821 /DNA_ORIENTATION=-
MAESAETAIAAGGTDEAMPSALCSGNSFVDALAQEREVMASDELGSGDQRRVKSAPALRRNSAEAQRRVPSQSEDNQILRAVSTEVNQKLIAENGQLRSNITHLKLVAELEHEKAPTTALERESQLLLEANSELTEENSRLCEENNDMHQKLTAALKRVDDLETLCETLRRRLDKPAGPGVWASDPVDQPQASGVSQESQKSPAADHNSSRGRLLKVSSGSMGSRLLEPKASSGGMSTKGTSGTTSKG